MLPTFANNRRSRILLPFLFLVTATGLFASDWTEGGLDVLILDCGYSDTGPTSLTTQQVDNLFKIGQSGGLDELLRRDSFDRAWYDSVEHVKVTLPQNKSAYAGNAFAAYSAAMDIAGKVEGDYDRIMVLAAGTVSSTGSAILAGRRSYYNGLPSLGVAHHEFFHNMGLGHANRWESSPEPRRADGSDVEYGDGNDVMGGGGTLNVVFKRQLDYLKEANGEIAQAVSGTTYRIFDHSNRDLSPANTELRAVYIPIEGPVFQNNRQLWLSHTYEQGDEEMRNGLQIHAWRMNGSSIPHRLDMSPGDHLSSDANAAKADIQSAELAIGQTYTDTQISSDASHPGAISITPIGKGITNGVNWIDVVVYSESAGSNTTPHSPSISGPSTSNTGASIALTASATDPDGDTLSYYWDFGDGTLSTDGASVQNKSWSTAGYYLVTVTISDRRGGTLRSEHWVNVGNQTARTPENDPATGDLTYRYYEGIFTVLPNFDDLLPVAEGTLATVGIPPVARDDNFALEITGYLEVPTSDIYRLILRSEDGSRLYIGDTLVIDNTGERNSPISAEGNIALDAGQHAITLQMRHRTGSETLELHWATLGQIPTQVGAGSLQGRDWGSNSLPTVSISSPAEGENVGFGTTPTFAATANDTGGIDRVQFFLGGSFLGEDTTAPYEWSWDASYAGDFDLTVLAKDSTGRIATDTHSFSVVAPEANQVAVNFVGSLNYGTTTAWPLSSGEEAGAVYVNGNWNNFTGSTALSDVALVNQNGAASPVRVSQWSGFVASGGPQYPTPEFHSLADTSTANGKMLKGLNWRRNDQDQNFAPYMTFDRIPYMEYEVYVYFDYIETDSADTSVQQFVLTSLDSSAPSPDPIFGKSSQVANDGDGDYPNYDTWTNFKEATASSSGSPDSELLGNYVVFRGQYANSFKLLVAGNGDRYINGIQIVEATPSIARLHLFQDDVPDQLSENGAPFSYQAVLSTAPAEPVAVTIGLDSEDLALDTYLLYFTPQNWNLPQSVTVYPLDNMDAEGNRTVHITHTLSQGYSDATDVVIPVNLLDDDLSTVNVTGLEPEVLEPGSSVVTYRVQRTGGAQDTALAVAFSLGGTADNDGTDYTIIGNGVSYDSPSGTGTLTLSANTVFEDIILSPVDDGLGEGPETVTCTLQASALYTVGDPSSASTTLLESITGFDLTEVFFPGEFDLNGKTITFTPTPTTDFYSAEVTNAAGFVTSSDGHTEQVSGDLDNGFYTVALSSRYLGVSYNTFYIGSNGYITFDSGDADSSWSAADHFSQLRISMFFSNMLVVNGSTSIKTGRAGSGSDARTVITVRNLKEKFDPVTMDYQVELFDDDRLRLTWLNASVDDSAVVGISGGLSSGGFSLIDYPTDLSALTPTTGNSPNTAPFFASNPRVALEQGLSYSSSVVTSDTDDDTLTLTAPTKPAWLTLTSTGNGSATLSGTPPAAGSYPVVLEVDDGTAAPVQQSFTIEVYAALANQPPAIIEHPSNLSVGYNEEARFRVIVSGNPTLQYQWYYEGNAIIDDGEHYSGATTYELTISNALNAADGGTPSNPNGDEGSYYCVVSNPYGEATSSAVTLAVGSPTALSIDTQPVNQTVNPGSSAVFTVAVSGTTPITYQWQKDGVDLVNGGDLSGVDTASLSIANVENADAGDYRVLVSNPSVSDEASTSGALTVNAVPQITLDSPIGAVANLVNLNDRLVMETTVSDDGLPGALILTWSQVSGSGTASFEDASTEDTTVTFDQTGDYVLRLTADDGLATDSVDLNVGVGSSGGGAGELARWTLNGTFAASNVSSDMESASDLSDVAINGTGWDGIGWEFDGVPVYPAKTDYARVTLTGAVGQNLDLNGGSVTFNSAYINGSRTGDGYTVDVISDPAGSATTLTLGTSDNADTDFDSGAISGFTPANVVELRIYFNNGQSWGDLQLGTLVISGSVASNTAPVTDAGPDAIATTGVGSTVSGSATDDGNPTPPAAISYQWSQLSGLGAASFGDVASPTSNVTFSTSGTYVLRLVADDGAVKTADDVTYTVSGDGLSPAEIWRDTYFNQTDNSGDAADDYDYDGDGVVNLLERAFGTNPTSSTSVELPSGMVSDDGGSDYLMITYRRLTGGTGETGIDYTVDGLTYTVEYDSDLIAPWSSGAVTPIGLPSDDGDGTETVTVRLNSSMGGETKYFIRVKVTSGE